MSMREGNINKEKNPYGSIDLLLAKRGWGEKAIQWSPAG